MSQDGITWNSEIMLAGYLPTKGNRIKVIFSCGPCTNCQTQEVSNPTIKDPIDILGIISFQFVLYVFKLFVQRFEPLLDSYSQHSF